MIVVKALPSGGLVKSSISSTFIEKPRKEVGTARTSVVVTLTADTGRLETTGDAAATAGISSAPSDPATTQSERSVCRSVKRRERALALTGMNPRLAALSD